MQPILNRVSLQRVLVLLIAAILIATVPIIVRHCQKIAEGTPHPVERRLMTLQPGLSAASFVAPTGELFNFVIGVSNRTTLVDGFQGSLSLESDGMMVWTNSFMVSNLRECNWLHRHGLIGYIIGWDQKPTNNPDLLHPGNRYTVKVYSGAPTSPDASIWITFIQSWGLYRMERNEIRSEKP